MSRFMPGATCVLRLTGPISLRDRVGEDNFSNRAPRTVIAAFGRLAGAPAPSSPAAGCFRVLSSGKIPGRIGCAAVFRPDWPDSQAEMQVRPFRTISWAIDG